VKIDLHMHTSRSDGRWSPQKLAAEATKRRLMAWAITDHDTIAAWRELAPQPGLLCGVEISTWDERGEIHVVALGIDPDHAELTAALANNVAIRRERAQVLLDHVAAKTGQRVTLDDCLPAEAGMITRSHIASALVRAGVVAYRQQAFNELIGDASVQQLYQPAYPSPAEAGELIRAAGGVSVLAHPGLYGDIHRIEGVMRGLDGIEVKHPNLDVGLQKLLMKQAAENNWLLSCGSDFHSDPCRLGDWRLSRSQAMPLLRAAGWQDPVRA
jgi:predicted metal-dependent phosphoesterase TrpH